MRVLAIDTSTADLVTGLVDTDSGAVVDRVVLHTRAHNEQLMPTVEALLAEASVAYADLGAVVVGRGPGPFTGLRVGMATALALGVALGIPVHGVCSHDAIAYGRSGQWLVATDARRKQVYWSAYRDGRRVAGPDVAAPEALMVRGEGYAVDRVVIAEELAFRLPADVATLPREEATPRAEQLVAVALAGGALDRVPDPVVPLYLRRPDAVPPRHKPRSSALILPAEMLGEC